jgi:hypothetical protein
MFKGTVSRDFRPSVILIKTSILGSWFSNINSNSRKYSNFLKCMQCHCHAPKNFSNNFEKWKSYAKQRWYAKKLKMHAVSLTPHAKYDTACTIDERFEPPWQPLKGISIKKTIYVHRIVLPRHSKKYTNLKGLPNKKFSCVRCHWHRMHDFCVSKIDHISANSKQNSKRP